MRTRAVVAGALAVLTLGCSPDARADDLLYDDFHGPDGVITSERMPAAPPWMLTSGTLYRIDDQGWTGVPDRENNSAVFRMVSIRRDMGDAEVMTQAQVQQIVTTPKTPAQDYDGLHIWVRYQSEYELYAVSVARRDNQMIIKKKCAGGTDNGGTYYDLTGYVPGPVTLGAWQQVDVQVTDLPNGSVQISARRDAFEMKATDDGVGCPPLHGGGVGIRGDNAELRFKHVEVQPLTQENR
jgi:hypothetical protein